MAVQNIRAPHDLQEMYRFLGYMILMLETVEKQRPLDDTEGKLYYLALKLWREMRDVR